MCMHNWVGNTAVEKLSFHIRAFGLIVSTDQLIFEKDVFRMGVSLTIKGFFFFFFSTNWSLLSNLSDFVSRMNCTVSPFMLFIDVPIPSEWSITLKKKKSLLNKWMVWEVGSGKALRFSAAANGLSYKDTPLSLDNDSNYGESYSLDIILEFILK